MFKIAMGLWAKVDTMSAARCRVEKDVLPPPRGNRTPVSAVRGRNIAFLRMQANFHRQLKCLLIEPVASILAKALSCKNDTSLENSAEFRGRCLRLLDFKAI
jgi:hypothetical protein